MINWQILVLSISVLGVLGLAIIVFSLTHRLLSFYTRPAENARLEKARKLVAIGIENEDNDFLKNQKIGKRDIEAIETISLKFLPKLKGESKKNLALLLENLNLRNLSISDLRNRNSIKRIRAAQLLGALPPSDESVRALIRSLKSRNSEVREAAAYALGNLGDFRAVEPLLGTLNPRKRVPAYVVASALIRIGSDGLTQIIAGLWSANEEARLISVIVLGDLCAVSCAEDMMRLSQLEQDDQVLEQLALALGKFGLPKASEFIVPLTDKQHSIRVRRAAIISLGVLCHEESIGLLASFIGTQGYEISTACATSLVSMGENGLKTLKQIYETQTPGWEYCREELTSAGVNLEELSIFRQASDSKYPEVKQETKSVAK